MAIFRKRAARFRWKVGPVSDAKPQDRSEEMLVLKDSQKVTLTVAPVDAAGNPAKVDGAPAWEIVGTNPECLAVTPSDDGLSATVVAQGPLGTAQVQVTADADLGEGNVPITGLLDVEVVAGDAVSLNIGSGEPTDK